MSYHGKLIGPNGQVYQCEHNHRTLTAAVSCANSSATRRMAQMAWNRSAEQAAHRAALAQRRAEERAAAEARRKAAQEAAAARRVAAQAAAEEAKAAKRAAKLAAMPPRRAWKKMTPDERLLKIAEAELGFYGEVVSPEAKAAYDSRAAKRPVANTSAPSAPAPPPRATVPLQGSATTGGRVSYYAVNTKNSQDDIASGPTHIIETGGGYKGLTLCGVLAGRFAHAFGPSSVSCGECRRRWQLAMAGEAVPPSPEQKQKPAAGAWPPSEPAPTGAVVPPTARGAADVPAYMRALDLSLSPIERALAKEQAAGDPAQWQKYVAALRAQKAYYEVPKKTGMNSGNSLPVDDVPAVTPATPHPPALLSEYVPPLAPAPPQARRLAGVRPEPGVRGTAEGTGDETTGASAVTETTEQERTTKEIFDGLKARAKAIVDSAEARGAAGQNMSPGAAEAFARQREDVQARARPVAAGPPRMSGASGGPADVRRPGDTASGNPAAGPPEGFGGDGLFVVGLDITPGVYRTAGPASERGGSVALMKSTSMRDLVDFSTVKGPITITVGPGIRAVKVSGCQPWQRLGDSLDEVIAAARKPGDTAGGD